MLDAIAVAAIARPEATPVPPQLGAAVRDACSHAWRAIEIVLAGYVLTARAGSASKPVRAAIEAVLASYGATRDAAAAFAKLRTARAAGALDAALDTAELGARCAAAGDREQLAARTAEAMRVAE